MAAYPALPSPTLTNPDMILPYGDYDSTPSPPQHPFRPSSPSDEWKGSRLEDLPFSIGPAHNQMGPMTPTTPIIYGNGTMLSDIGEVTEAESTPGRKLPGPAERRLLKQAQGLPLRSSPTMGYSSYSVIKRAKSGTHERKVSVESTSTVTSEGQAAELFKDFDDGVSVDDSNFQGDDEESVADSYGEEVIAMETQRLSRRESRIGGDEDPNSSAALSRRAEQILLNAKKRLNNMEGNLTRARGSLYTTPSSSISSIHCSSPLSRSTPSPPNDRQILGMTHVASHQLHTPVEAPTTSPGHSRVFSETSITSTLRTAPFPVRSASAAARYMGRSGTESIKESSPLNEDLDSAREEPKRHGISPLSSKLSPPHPGQLKSLSEDDVLPEFEVDHTSVRSSMRDRSSSPNGENRGLTRPTSSMQMRDLRDQMHDLKGRLSVLRDRARDDTMKRRSLQSLRTPSPFTAAEQWYTAAKSYPSASLSADAGVGHSPVKEGTVETNEQTLDGVLCPEGEDESLRAPGYAGSEVTSVYESVSDGVIDGNTMSHELHLLEEETFYSTAGAEDDHSGFEEERDNHYNDEIVNRDELDDYESDTSLYHDTTSISHEDREDAFDYEHFFLHSAMGTISRQGIGRRGSFSSEDSVETTRGPPAQELNNEVKRSKTPRVSLGHLRSESTDSVSTMATFATATEGLGSENGGSDTQDYFFGEKSIVTEVGSTGATLAKSPAFEAPVLHDLAEYIETPVALDRPTSAIHNPEERNNSDLHRPSIASFDSVESTGTTRSFPLINKPKSVRTLTPNGTSNPRPSQQGSLSDSPTITEDQSNDERLQPSPVRMLAKDDQGLVEKVVASLGKCVLGLQDAAPGSYEGRVWRRRLDAARRLLDGEEGADI